MGVNKDLIVDTSVPTISSVSLNAANTELTVTFAEDVYNTNGGSGDLEVADFALSISGGAAGVNATPASIAKTAQNIWVLGLTLTGGTANGGETLTVVPAASTSIYDKAGNAASTSQSGNTASLTEKILPTITDVTSTTGNGSYKQGQTIAITVEFSEAVNVTGTPQLTLETGGSDAVVDYSSGTGSTTLTFNYTIGSGETSGDLDYESTSSLALNSGTIKDAALNAATLTLATPGDPNSLGANKDLIVDTTVPTVTGVTSTTGNDSYKQGETIAITVVFSEVVNVTGTPQLTLETGGSDAVVDYSSGTGSTTLTFNYTIGSGETSGDLDYESTSSLALNSGTIKDAALNAATLTLASPGATNSLGVNKDLIVDTSVPTISSVSLNAANTELTVTFAEDVYNTNGGSGDLEVADFALSISGGAAGVNATPASIAKTAQNIWVLGLTLTGGTANGGETLTVVPAASTSIYDKAGNAASTSQSGNTASLTEKILPTITDVTSTTGNGSYKQGQTIAITVEFSEAVNVTGTPQLTLETGGSDAVVDYSSGTGSTTLTFNYTIGSGETSGDLDYESTSSLALNSGTIKDAALNAATLTLATPGDPNSLGANKDLIVDTTVPTVTGVTSTTGNDSYKQGETIAITVVFSEVVNVTGTPQLTLETGGSDAVVDYSSGTGSTTLTFNYTIGSGETSGDLDYESTSSLALNSGTIKDAALNAATLTLASPGATNSLGVNKDLIVDTSVPTISSVSLNAANTELTVTFAEDVYNTNGGSGDLEVADFALSISGGAAGVNATPASIAKTAQNIWVLGLTLTGGTANGGETLTVVPAASTSIYDKAGNAASTSQSGNTASLTEKILPTITDVTSTTGNGSYKQGQTIAITVEFSEAVNVTGTPQLTLETGGSDAVVDYSSGTGSTTLTFNYTIGSGETSGDLDYESTSSLALNSGTIKDAALNAATLTLATPGDPNSLGANKDLIVDTTVPTVTGVTSTTGNDSYKQGETIAITVVFSEVVNVTGTPQLTLETGGSDAVVDYSSGTGSTTLTFNYTIGSGETSGDLDYESTSSLALNSGTIKDAALNAATLTLASPGATNSLGVNKDLIVDTSVPTISSVSLNAANTELTVTFAEDVYNTNGGSGDLEVADFALSISGGAAGVNATPASIAKTAQNIWVLGLTLTGGTANGGETLTVVPAASTSIYDKAGNAASTSQSGNTASLTEKILPTITDVTSTTGNGSYKQGQTIAITVEFSEAVNVTGTPQLTLETGGSDAVVDYSSGTGSTTLTFNYTIGSGETSGDLDYESTSSLALNSGTIKDAALNAATLTLATPGDPNSLGANKDLIVDTTVPTVTGVTSTTGNDSYKQGETIAITVVFSEVVNVTGTPQLTLETGGSDAVVDYSSGTGSTTLTFNYTIGSGETSGDLDYESTSSLALNSGTIKDAALNAATLTLASPGATNSLGVNKDLIVDTSVPTISSVSLNAANTELTVTFAEDVYNTNGGSGDLEVADFALSISGGAAGVNATPASIAKTAQNIWVLGLTLTGGTANGGETLTVVPAASTSIYDKAGNAASTSQSGNTASLTEKILPTITDVTSTTGNGSYKQGQTIAITVEFSEAVNVTGTPQLTLETGGSDAVVDYSSGTGSTTLTFNYTIGSGETSGDLDYESTSSLALNSGTIKDAALNAATLTLATPGDPNSLGANKDLIVDTTVPTVTGISGSYSSSDQTTVTLTLTGVTANNTSLTISPDYDDATGTIKDNAGNEMSFSETVSGTDGASPAMLSAATGDSNTNGSVDQIVITFSEQVDLSNVDNNNFTLTESAGGSSLAVSGSYSSNNQTSVTLNLTGVTANNTSLTISPDYNDATGTIIDNAGNEMSFSETVVGTDGAVPVFSSITPTENSSIKVADVGYRLSETIANGSVTYRRTGGTADVSSPHAVSLSGSELNLGVRSLAALTNAPTLTSGATYMLEFNGTDLSGNVGSELTVTGIVFDGAAPTFIKAWQYDTDGNGNIDEIVLELSEAVSDASVVYGDFALGSGSITGFSQASGSSANSKDVANDDQYITLEVSVTGSAAVSVSYTDNNSGNDLEDLAGNDVASNASITTDDQALPGILSTSWQDTDSDGGIDRAVLTFSESVDIRDGRCGEMGLARFW